MRCGLFQAATLAACALAANAQLQYGPNANVGYSITQNNWAQMQAAGWRFLAGYNGLNNLPGRNRCDQSYFHFYANSGNQARLTVTLRGSGCARIAFSNCWQDGGSFVGIWLAGSRIAQTVTTAPSATVVHTFNYTNGQVLEIRDEGANAVAEIESLVFMPSSDCASDQFGPNAALGTTINANNWPAMQTAGWRFLAGYNGLGILGSSNDCGEQQFHFYANSGNQARLAATLQGSGCAVITFSNCWNTPNSFVGLWLGGNRIGRTPGANAPSAAVTIRFNYSNSQVLEIRDEGANAVAEIDSLYFLEACTEAPTPAPTAAPTGWYQAPGVPNITTLDARVQALESQQTATSATLLTQAAQASTAVNSLQGLVGALDNNAQAQSTLAAQQSTLLSQQAQSTSTVMSQVSTLSTSQALMSGTVSSVLSALRTAVQNAATGGGGSEAPQVSSTPANELVLTSGAAVRVSSGTCSNSDLCGAASFASTLKQALAQV